MAMYTGMRNNYGLRLDRTQTRNISYHFRSLTSRDGYGLAQQPEITT